MDSDKPTMTCERSPTIAKIAAALAKAQTAITGAKKDATNPHFRNKYATLASVWDACHEALNAEQIAIVQMPRTTEAGVEVETLLAHASGEWISSRLTMPLSDKATAQQVGSAVTYGRRYALAAMTGVAPDDDDDGNAASDAPPEPRQQARRARPRPAPEPDQAKEYAQMKADIAEQLEVLRELEPVDPKRLREQCGIKREGNLTLGDLKLFLAFVKSRIMDAAGVGDMPPDFGGKAAS